MLLVPKQNNLTITLHCSLITEAVIARAEITENIHDLFSANVFLHSNKQIDIQKILNQTAVIKIKKKNETLRHFHGVIDKASIEPVPNLQASITEDLLFIHIVPTIARMEYSRNYNIWLDKSALEIVEEVLKNNNIYDYKFTTSKYNNKKLAMCVQYGESDLHFICRLLEENGIFYYIQHTEKTDTFIMSNSSISGDKLPNTLSVIKTYSQDLYPLNGSQNVSIAHSIGIKNINHKSYNYEKTNIIDATVNRVEDTNINQFGCNNYYDNVYENKIDGNDLCKMLLEEKNSTTIKLSATTYSPLLYPGSIVNLNGSNETTHNGEFFILSVKHTINQLNDDVEIPIYKNTFEAIPRDTVFRPTHIHKKPRIWGCQTAIVVGAKNEEVCCDKDGRVKVHFHWANNNQISCWIRVGTLWSGTNFGSVIIPRVGMEVIVSFIDGDPNQPLITGCVYNGTHLPPGKYPEAKTVSSFCSNSVGSKGFNELRFDDKGNNEEIYIHAQKNLKKLVENNTYETLNDGSKFVTLESKKGAVNHSLVIKHGNKTIIIEDGNSAITLQKGNSSIILENGNSDITLSNGNSTIKLLNGDQSITLSKGNQTITLSNGDLNINVIGNVKIHASQNIKIKADNNIDIEGNNINVKARSNYSLNSLNANIVGTTSVDIKGNTSVDLKGGTFNAKADTTMSIESGLTMDLKAPVSINLN